MATLRAAYAHEAIRAKSAPKEATQLVDDKARQAASVKLDPLQEGLEVLLQYLIEHCALRRARDILGPGWYCTRSSKHARHLSPRRGKAPL